MINRRPTSMLEKYERKREYPVLWDTLSSQLLESKLIGIGGFKLKVEEIQVEHVAERMEKKT